MQRAARNWQQEEAAGSPSRPDIDSLSDRERVTVSQRELNRLDYDAGPTDVAMGSRTRTAIYHYQTDLGIAQNDRASTNLLQRLRQTETHEVTAPTISSGAALRDNFNDGDYRFNPGWTLLSGDFEDGRLHNIVWTRARNKRMQSAWTAAIR